ncbi:uncharacterized protein WCC33_012427 isoform 2-T2 [Rhinophrynus dorsalis]
MALNGFVVLLLLGLVVTQVHSETNPLCSILNETLGNSTNTFSMQISKEMLIDNETYTVTINGSGNATVILQALSSSAEVGNWSKTNDSCGESPLFINPFDNVNVSLTATWKSPQNVSSVNITAHIKQGNETFRISKTLDAAVATVPPSTTNGTVSNSTQTPNTTGTIPNSTQAPNITGTTGNATQTTVKPDVTTTSLPKTTSMGAANHPSSMFMAIIQTLGLLAITRKLLS